MWSTCIHRGSRDSAADDADAVRLARLVLGYADGRPAHGSHEDQRRPRRAMPENRRRAYDVRDVMRLLFDVDSVLELRERHGRSLVTASARLGGRPVGAIANNPLHRAGAIDATAAGKASRFLRRGRSGSRTAGNWRPSPTTPSAGAATTNWWRSPTPAARRSPPPRALELDDVVDPADTRSRLLAALF
ncbi:carboxyl transferase domain-containing protein [Micromonospora sp. NPDC047707]|uniref:carboxyl transferase domain-containing protein n=1 Tax=Micromonospora sp. NPDC047707 TaxID=3154498 RepID=UPI0034518E9B